MAKRKQKTQNVAKFGGVDELGQIKSDLHSPLKEQTYDASSVEAKSEQTHLEDDIGVGEATVLRNFVFAIDLSKTNVWLERRPTKQDLFNAHLKGIEMALWKDGLKVWPDVAPQLMFDVNNLKYTIIVAARPMKGFMLQERPQTLAEIVNG